MVVQGVDNIREVCAKREFVNGVRRAEPVTQEGKFGSAAKENKEEEKKTILRDISERIDVVNVHVVLLKGLSRGDVDVSSHLVDLNVPVKAAALIIALQLFCHAFPLALWLSTSFFSIILGSRFLPRTRNTTDLFNLSDVVDVPAHFPVCSTHLVAGLTALHISGPVATSTITLWKGRDWFKLNLLLAKLLL